MVRHALATFSALAPNYCGRVVCTIYPTDRRGQSCEFPLSEPVVRIMCDELASREERLLKEYETL